MLRDYKIEVLYLDEIKDRAKHILERNINYCKCVSVDYEVKKIDWADCLKELGTINKEWVYSVVIDKFKLKYAYKNFGVWLLDWDVIVNDELIKKMDKYSKEEGVFAGKDKKGRYDIFLLCNRDNKKMKFLVDYSENFYKHGVGALTLSNNKNIIIGVEVEHLNLGYSMQRVCSK